MIALLQRLRGCQQPQVPAEIYIPIVDSLYSETRTLFLGSLAVSLAVLLTAWKTGEPLIYLCWVILIVIATARAFDMATYARHRAALTSVEVAAGWEFRYALGAAGFMGMLGVWCVVCFATTSDPFVELVSIVSTVAYSGLTTGGLRRPINGKRSIGSATTPICVRGLFAQACAAVSAMPSTISTTAGSSVSMWTANWSARCGCM
jgi:hypothetical protein